MMGGDRGRGIDSRSTEEWVEKNDLQNPEEDGILHMKCLKSNQANQVGGWKLKKESDGWSRKSK